MADQHQQTYPVQAMPVRVHTTIKQMAFDEQRLRLFWLDAKHRVYSSGVLQQYSSVATELEEEQIKETEEEEEPLEENVELGGQSSDLTALDRRVRDADNNKVILNCTLITGKCIYVLFFRRTKFVSVPVPMWCFRLLLIRRPDYYIGHPPDIFLLMSLVYDSSVQSRTSSRAMHEAANFPIITIWVRLLPWAFIVLS